MISPRGNREKGRLTFLFSGDHGPFMSPWPPTGSVFCCGPGGLVFIGEGGTLALLFWGGAHWPRTRLFSTGPISLFGASRPPQPLLPPRLYVVGSPRWWARGIWIAFFFWFCVCRALYFLFFFQCPRVFVDFCFGVWSLFLFCFSSSFFLFLFYVFCSSFLLFFFSFFLFFWGGGWGESPGVSPLNFCVSRVSSNCEELLEAEACAWLYINGTFEKPCLECCDGGRDHEGIVDW